MAVSKRLRFDILRRDGHRCKYCGRTADEVKLTVDHVTPIALGGTDAPENLAAACGDCNSGKSSVPADAAVVADVEQKAVAWAVARKRVTAELEQEFADQTAAATRIKNAFVKVCKAEYGTAPKVSADWATSIARWLQLGLPEAKIQQLAAYTACRQNVTLTGKWKYFAGACWAVVREIEDRATKAAGTSAGELASASEECSCLEDHDSHECLVDALWGEWYSQWKKSGESRPTNQDDETFMRSAYAVLDDHEVRRTDVFIAARLAGANQSTDLAAWLNEAKASDPLRLESHAIAAWIAWWIQRDTAEVPTDAEWAEFHRSLSFATKADYKPEAIIQAAGLAGSFGDTNLARYVLTIPDLIEAEGMPWPEPVAPEGSDG